MTPTDAPPTAELISLADRRGAAKKKPEENPEETQEMSGSDAIVMVTEAYSDLIKLCSTTLLEIASDPEAPVKTRDAAGQTLTTVTKIVMKVASQVVPKK